jgi:hypothetical protein
MEPPDPDHPTIYLEPSPGDPHTGREWCQHDVWSDRLDDYDGVASTKYVRADLVGDALRAARKFVEWPAGAERMQQVLDLIDGALKNV